ETTAILHLDASSHAEQLQFLPGQYARLQIPDTEDWRSYSFANRPNATNQLQFLIRLLPDGVMSNYLRDRCQVGQSLLIEAPLGSFYLREVERPLVFVAGGTVFSSFFCILHYFVEQPHSPPFLLFYCVNILSLLFLQHLFHSYSEQLPSFIFHPFLSISTLTFPFTSFFIPFPFNSFQLSFHSFFLSLF
ncbi:anthranilate dioxygenase reductase, partial [Acinetobacter pittii]|uniref:FAD-binding oxidoreductase n=1 Tax=Acinetobacter pittii TaxID=48296 RepID=UPI00227D222A